ncbi:MAG TPA: FliH/SctL family protein [Anaerohalosphaeraceae bacterium]|nr:hypothetical protein [Phycisphaerae bacterium]HOK94936.1 FliH/SctL family protein [Anaerohalosphaeraceae bacterium]HOL30758.1 FliH/SctL family protein [Anaerohalosphaeraceae bacterium]HOM75427.1 FliH/SctL family protein [Anaerohalosphaeraceae bacterium]HPC63013.1 FliH/SctL family protein [Anaerohalosphaeraceae bacterium]
MFSALVISVDKPIAAVKLADSQGAASTEISAGGPSGPACDACRKSLDRQKQLYQNACLIFQEAAEQMHRFCDELLAGHQEAIARLSVEIARKILMCKISQGDYDIEARVREALHAVPKCGSITVRLNPQDLSDLQSLQQEHPSAAEGIQLTADASLGRAECVVESPRGIVSYLINEQLEQVGKALAKTH